MRAVKVLLLLSVFFADAFGYPDAGVFGCIGDDFDSTIATQMYILSLLNSLTDTCCSSTCNQPVLVSQSDVAGGALNIDCPGVYQVTEPLTAPAGATLFDIQVDDVIIDLNSFTVMGTGSGADLIIIGTGHKNITIYNGLVRDAGANGIHIQANTENISLIEIDVQDSLENGIQIDSSSNGLLLSCTSSNNTQNGIECNDVSSYSFKGCVANNNNLSRSYDGSDSQRWGGFVLSALSAGEDCSHNTFLNCRAEENNALVTMTVDSSSVDESIHAIAGGFVVMVENNGTALGNTYDFCVSDANSVDARLTLSSFTGASENLSSALVASGGFILGVGSGDGLTTSGGEHKYNDCSARDNGGNISGYAASSGASGNGASVVGVEGGFVVGVSTGRASTANCNANRYNSCIAEDNTGDAFTSGGGYGYGSFMAVSGGFVVGVGSGGIESLSNENSYNNCIANNNGASGRVESFAEFGGTSPNFSSIAAISGGFAVGVSGAFGRGSDTFATSTNNAYSACSADGNNAQAVITASATSMVGGNAFLRESVVAEAGGFVVGVASGYARCDGSGNAYKDCFALNNNNAAQVVGFADTPSANISSVLSQAGGFVLGVNRAGAGNGSSISDNNSYTDCTATSNNTNLLLTGTTNSTSAMDNGNGSSVFAQAGGFIVGIGASFDSINPSTVSSNRNIFKGCVAENNNATSNVHADAVSAVDTGNNDNASSALGAIGGFALSASSSFNTVRANNNSFFDCSAENNNTSARVGASSFDGSTNNSSVLSVAGGFVLALGTNSNSGISISGGDETTYHSCIADGNNTSGILSASGETATNVMRVGGGFVAALSASEFSAGTANALSSRNKYILCESRNNNDMVTTAADMNVDLSVGAGYVLTGEQRGGATLTAEDNLYDTCSVGMGFINYDLTGTTTLNYYTDRLDNVYLSNSEFNPPLSSIISSAILTPTTAGTNWEIANT